MYSKAQFALWNKHFLKIFARLYLIIDKLVIMAIQVWQSTMEVSFVLSNFLEFVCNKQEWLSYKMVFGLNTNPKSRNTCCVGALSTTPKYLGDQFKKFATSVHYDQRVSLKVSIPVIEIPTQVLNSTTNIYFWLKKAPKLTAKKPKYSNTDLGNMY